MDYAEILSLLGFLETVYHLKEENPCKNIRAHGIYSHFKSTTMERLVYAEIESVTEEMRNDKRVLIISDNAVFMVTTKANSRWYNLYFESVPADAIEAYEIEVKDGKVSSVVSK